MPKKLIQRYMPTPDKIRGTKSLQFLGDLLHEPNLWHINRHAVCRAMVIGLFWASIPMPFQMVPAALFAVWFKANLPMSMALVWLTNPITMPPVFYFNYQVGAWLLSRPPLPFELEFSWRWISERLVDVGAPLYCGSVVVGIVSGCACYVLMQAIWRRKIRRDWAARGARRAATAPV